MAGLIPQVPSKQPDRERPGKLVQVRGPRQKQVAATWRRTYRKAEIVWLFLADLRSFQDWTLRYALDLESVKAVSEVASVGGFVKQYQVDLDPNALVAYIFQRPACSERR